jgi:hypothetical protein
MARRVPVGERKAMGLANLTHSVGPPVTYAFLRCGVATLNRHPR